MLKHTWEQGIFLDIGVDKNITADRILFLYDTQSCVYPAQNLDDLEKTWVYQYMPFYKAVRDGDKEYVIERNVDDLFGTDKKYWNFWAPIKNKLGTRHGVIGLQLLMDDIEYVLPKSTTEGEYPGSLLKIFDRKMREIYHNEHTDHMATATYGYIQKEAELMVESLEQYRTIKENDPDTQYTYDHMDANLRSFVNGEFNVATVTSPLEYISRHELF